MTQTPTPVQPVTIEPTKPARSIASYLVNRSPRRAMPGAVKPLMTVYEPDIDALQWSQEELLSLAGYAPAPGIAGSDGAAPKKPNALLLWLLRRAREPSSWRGAILLCTSLGVYLQPETAEAIVGVGIAIAGLIGVLVGDAPAAVD